VTARQTWGYLIAWEFRPRKGSEADFEQTYGPNGVWTKFFQRCEGFVATELNRDANDPGRYWTLDLWTSKAAYDRFRFEHQAGYQAIDAQCEKLTEQETELGRFERVG
jgi:heme-degrading monooxygenase HmoA